MIQPRLLSWLGLLILASALQQDSLHWRDADPRERLGAHQVLLRQRPDQSIPASLGPARERGGLSCGVARSHRNGP